MPSPARVFRIELRRNSMWPLLACPMWLTASPALPRHGPSPRHGRLASSAPC